jgi:putative ABC transport system ATP-binding protein
MNEHVLEGRNLVKTFGAGHTEVRAVDGVSLTIRRGELVLIMGPSGSGKTTLVSMLGGLLRPTEGRVLIEGSDITALPESALPQIRARKVGFVFQAFNLLEALTTEENILFPARLVPGGIADARKRAQSLIERLDLVKRRQALPGTLSGGEKQRVAIARALINAPPVILADEPTGNLDSASGQEVMMVLHDIARDEGRSVILVTHDPRAETARPSITNGRVILSAACASMNGLQIYAPRSPDSRSYSARLAANRDSRRTRRDMWRKVRFLRKTADRRCSREAPANHPRTRTGDARCSFRTGSIRPGSYTRGKRSRDCGGS